jgi:hypothetical protein
LRRTSNGWFWLKQLSRAHQSTEEPCALKSKVF